MRYRRSRAATTDPDARLFRKSRGNNCELQLFMAPTDADTLRYISEAIGDQTRMVRVKSWRQQGWDAASIQERQEGIRLIRPEQIRLLGPDAAIALVRDQNPVRLLKARYYADRALNRLFEGQHGAPFFDEPPEMPKTPLPGELQTVPAPTPKPAASHHALPRLRRTRLSSLIQ